MLRYLKKLPNSTKTALFLGASIGIHASALLLPLDSPQRTLQDKPVKVAPAPAPISLKLAARPTPKPQATAKAGIAKPKPAPTPAVTPRTVAQRPPALPVKPAPTSPPESPPAPVQPPVEAAPSSPPAPSAPTVQPSPPAQEPKHIDRFAFGKELSDLSYMADAKLACNGDCLTISGDKNLTEVSDDLQRLEAQGYSLTQSDREDDQGVRVYQVSKSGEPTYYVHLISTNQGIVYLEQRKELTSAEVEALRNS